MDIYEYLKQDHKKVSKMFDEFKKTKSPVYKVELVAMIIQELHLHAISEQETFYKVLEKFEVSKDEACHGEKEHKDIDAQLDEVVNTKNFNASWERKVLKLKKIVDHHVNDEENKLFRKAKKVLSKEDALILKEKMHDYKVKLLQALV